MARVSDNVLPSGSVIGMTLDRYQEIMRLDTCAFNGINRPTDNHDSQCVDILTQNQRDYIAEYLMQAKEMREEEIGYYIYPQYRTEHQDVVIDNPFMLDKKHLIEIGMPTETVIEDGVVVNYGVPPFTAGGNEPTDPVVLTVATTVTDPEEIVVNYPGESVRIHPTSVTIAGGNATITIPRCRLVDPAFDGNLDDPPSYYDEVFLEEVDVHRLYSDASDGAEFVWNRNPCDNNVACDTVCQAACTVVLGHMAYELSTISVYPATYSSGSWVRACLTYPNPNHIRVTYKSGITASMRNEIDTIRLTHVLMPYPPCQCDMVKNRWEGDRNRLTTQWSPYGNYQGAIDVWMKDSRKKSGGGGTFPRLR
jgi:hypothetical protein